MKYSDDKLNNDVKDVSDKEQQPSAENADGGLSRSEFTETETAGERVAPFESLSADTEKNNNDRGSRSNDKGASSGGAFAVELARLSVKVVAVALSVVLLITCILAVMMPLQTMRIFNDLGMSARAVDFGERYINGELEDHGAQELDARGNYVKLAATPELTNAEMTEALYVCIDLSYRMMNAGYETGDAAVGEYYARLTEKYTRMYMSLNGASELNMRQSQYNIEKMPSLAMRPMVYSYAHTIRVMNYRARAYLGDTSTVLYDSGRNGDCVTELQTRSNTYYGLNIPENRNSLMAVLDGYVDFADQLGEYLDVEFVRAGVENDLSKRSPEGNSIVSEAYVIPNYTNFLNGDEFSLLLDRTNGFSVIYNQFKRFGTYAQVAVDFLPSNNNNARQDEMLHQLYWLQALASVAQRFWYMSMLTYYSREKFGAAFGEIRDEYGRGTCQSYSDVIYEGKRNTLLGVYRIKLEEYISQYQL